MPNHLKKVALISVHGDPLVRPGSIEAGGQNVYVYSLAKELVRLGWQVDIFTRLDKKSKKKQVRLKSNLRVIRIEAGPRKFISKDEIYNFLPEFLKGFLDFILENKQEYSIVHTNYWLSGWLGIQLKRVLNVPLTHTFHSLGYIKYHTLKRFGQSNNQSDFFQLRINCEKEIIALADRLITTNTYEKKDLIKYYEVAEYKMRVIPVGVDIKKFKPRNKKQARKRIKISNKKKVILYVGRFEWRKGIYTLIAAVKDVLKQEPKLKDKIILVLVGGPRKSKLFQDQGYQEVKKAVEKAGLEQYVDFRGGQKQSRIVDFYAACDVVVVPSYYEPFGIITLEAMSMKVPVIASRTGGLQYSIRHKKSGILTPPHRNKFLANRIIEVLQDKKIRSILHQYARDRVLKYFAWSKIAKEVSEFYLSIINNDNGKKQPTKK